VFVGYGVAAAEWRWDDYKDMDVRGKVLLMLVNDPGLQDSTVFNGRALTYYGRWTYQLGEAPRRGAVGAILLHTAESATYGWDVLRGSWSVGQIKLDPPVAQTTAFAALVTPGAAPARADAVGRGDPGGGGRPARQRGVHAGPPRPAGPDGRGGGPRCRPRERGDARHRRPRPAPVDLARRVRGGRSCRSAGGG